MDKDFKFTYGQELNNILDSNEHRPIRVIRCLELVRNAAAVSYDREEWSALLDAAKTLADD